MASSRRSRSSSSRRAAAALLAALAAGAAGQASGADAVTGPARATAAETLVVANARFRFAGLAAPEGSCGGAPCAEAARARLQELVAAAGPVTCSRGARLGHGVYEGTCRLADGRDPARVLVGEGLLRPEPP